VYTKHQKVFVTDNSSSTGRHCVAMQRQRHRDFFYWQTLCCHAETKTSRLFIRFAHSRDTVTFQTTTLNGVTSKSITFLNTIAQGFSHSLKTRHFKKSINFVRRTFCPCQCNSAHCCRSLPGCTAAAGT
jgi:hypothetical protein